MALLQDLILQIDDPTLRERILRETDKLVNSFPNGAPAQYVQIASRGYS